MATRILTYGNEIWTMTNRDKQQSAQMKFLRRLKGSPLEIELGMKRLIGN